ncbi:hypothetical protein L596_017884 [Steinernema carpocapsae]|uniref:Uncharacterized protein n=1 Tax=Steinernema carpocapsae TaxID=34508 RepID=A0A4U5N2Z8_STECR|nr:hypothetical protein L596_017884 [Steinernema carpocapsae]
MDTLNVEELRRLVSTFSYGAVKRIQPAVWGNPTWLEAIKEKLATYNTVCLTVENGYAFTAREIWNCHFVGVDKNSIDVGNRSFSISQMISNLNPDLFLTKVTISGDFRWHQSSYVPDELTSELKNCVSLLSQMNGASTSGAENLKDLDVWDYLQLPFGGESGGILEIKDLTRTNNAFLENLIQSRRFTFFEMKLFRISNSAEILAKIIDKTQSERFLKKLHISECDLSEDFFEVLQCVVLQSNVEEMRIEACNPGPNSDFFLDLIQLWKIDTGIGKRRKAYFEAEDKDWIMVRLHHKSGVVDGKENLNLAKMKLRLTHEIQTHKTLEVRGEVTIGEDDIGEATYTSNIVIVCGVES